MIVLLAYISFILDFVTTVTLGATIPHSAASIWCTSRYIINVRTPSAIKAKVVFHSQARRIAGEDEAEAIRKNGIEYTLEQADLGTGGNTIDIQNIQYVGDPAFNKRDVIDFDVEFPGKELPTPNKGQMSWTLNANNELELNARLVNPQGVMMALISKWKVLPNSRTSFMIPSGVNSNLPKPEHMESTGQRVKWADKLTSKKTFDPDDPLEPKGARGRN
ncbi:MAG: hypothetical protein NXY57DRAFT_1111159 [Lentinula lateritia]|uniref:Uncharacterized protein n=1 Tax=Lentinula lateritia TaxID=40482 RepID=A0ABQ8VBU2_9AGAR|nr:MAG: hypothetical protein NXY57DRAFT_1111159 [Lentinula lateritia]KAJ4486819.1 hypothetical protein C8R41DRAFT_868218 [Lentinula lateritia]